MYVLVTLLTHDLRAWVFGEATTFGSLTHVSHVDGCESEWTQGVGDGQGDLACCDSRGREESDTTKWLNWTELNWITFGDE